MIRIVQAIMVPVLALAGLAATALAADPDTPVGPGNQYQTLLRGFNETARALYEATTDEERNTVAVRMENLTPRFLELAERNPNDPIAIDSLVQVVLQEIWLENNTSRPGRGKESLEGRAIALLMQHHIRSEKLGEACRRMSYGFHRDCEKFLRTVVETNPHKEVQGLACLRLAQFLNGRLRRIDLLNGKPEMATRYEGLFGKDYIDELRRQDRVAAVSEIETIFERAAKDFGDIALPYGGNVGGTARSELHEIRHLSVGKAAPEIESEDQDGAHFKLSDRRGKVVLLYFWSEY